MTDARDDEVTAANDGSGASMPDGSDEQQADDLSWTERPKRRRGPGILVSIACIALCGYLMFEMRQGVAYWLTAPGEPVALDAQLLADAKALDALDNRLVRMQGTPGSSAARFKKLFVAHEIVALSGSPVLLQRPPTRAAGTAASQDSPPDRAPVDVEGRLVRDTSLTDDYGVAFAAFVQRREVKLLGGHLYVLFQDERPRAGLSTPLLFLGLALLLLMNGRYLIRALR